MTSVRVRARSLGLALASAVPLLLAAGKAMASPDLVLDGQTVSMSGTQHYRYVRLLNGARIVVPAYDGQSGTTTGRLEVIATDILIDGTSSIDADAAGFRGLVDQNGEGLAGGKGALVSADATGGGGHAGKGGDGVLLAGCAPIAGATGGAALTGSLTDVTFGSAGSAPGTAGGGSGGRGGSGGGAIVLRAGKIEISGTVTANGGPGEVVADDSSGGGAGGGVLVQTSYFQSFGGRIDVLGASGGTSTDDEGGGGGGGRVLLLVPAFPNDLHLGILGGAATCAAAQGGLGDATLVPSSGCVDLDGDGYTSAACGGSDCDDSDPLVHPNATELCNGQDDDCSGVADDHDASASCQGAACVAGACATADGGSDALADGPLDAEASDATSSSDTGWADVVPDAGADDAETDGATGSATSSEGSQDVSLVLRGGCSLGAPGGAGGGRWLWLGCVVLVFRHLRRPR